MTLVFSAVTSGGEGQRKASSGATEGRNSTSAVSLPALLSQVRRNELWSLVRVSSTSLPLSTAPAPSMEQAAPGCGGNVKDQVRVALAFLPSGKYSGVARRPEIMGGTWRPEAFRDITAKVPSLPIGADTVLSPAEAMNPGTTTHLSFSRMGRTSSDSITPAGSPAAL